MTAFQSTEREQKCYVSLPGLALNIYLHTSYFPCSFPFCQVDTEEHSNAEGHVLKIMEHREQTNLGS